MRASKDGPGARRHPSRLANRLAPLGDGYLNWLNMAKANQANTSPVLSSDRTAALALTPVSRETEARLDRYVDLLVEWQAKTNLVAPSTLPNLWTRHISDSLQLLSLAPSAKIWVDLGSGGGFPGVVLA